MTNLAEDLKPLLQDEPPAVQKAVLRALQLLKEDDGPSPNEAVGTLVGLGATLAKGGAPTAALIVEAIAALLTLRRTIQQERKKKITKSRRDGTAAGLAAYQASKLVGGQENAKRASKAWSANRRRKR